MHNLPKLFHFGDLKVVADLQKDRQRKRESRCGDAQVIPPNEPFTGNTKESLSKATLWR